MNIPGTSTGKAAVLKDIKLIVSDFDGVMTDNAVLVGQDGHEFVVCNRADGLGIKLIRDMGIETIAIKRTTGTDHVPFNQIGLPGFQFIQDPINYMSRTHHTNMDVVDNLIESDLIHNSLVVASVIYHAAMMETKMPRKVMPTIDEID